MIQKTTQIIIKISKQNKFRFEIEDELMYVISDAIYDLF